MSALELIVTPAGRAALVNAENTGTLPVLVAEIGVTDQVFDAAEHPDALPGELKRLATFAGDAVAADTIHVTIRDDSADVYSWRGFALYLDGGTLFASYGQADVILEKSAQAMALLSTDTVFEDIAASSLTFGDAGFLNPAATTERQGVLELATNAEAIAGADASRGIVPSALRAVLDSRFGGGAPSAFVKSLLVLATAALLRTAIGIKSAALKDEGPGNNLNADLLDGQHGAYYLNWANFANVPGAFPPQTHNHSIAQVTGLQAALNAKANTADLGSAASKGINYFAPADHLHAMGDVNGLQAALDAKASLTSPQFGGQPRSTRWNVGVVPYIYERGGSASGNLAFNVNGNVWDFAVDGVTTLPGDVNASRVRLSAGTDVSPASTGHALQIGPTSGSNLRMDGNEVMSVTDGVPDALFLNSDGGLVKCGGDLQAVGVVTARTFNATP